MNRREDYFQKLLELMDTLRGPGGCPWDQEQTRETLKPLLVEEAFEVLEALDGSDSNELCDELGDLLFQVIFHSRIAQEKEEFDIHDVCRRSYEKMVRPTSPRFWRRTLPGFWRTLEALGGYQGRGKEIGRG